jgi:hypothetical protein
MKLAMVGCFGVVRERQALWSGKLRLLDVDTRQVYSKSLGELDTEATEGKHSSIYQGW